VPIVIPEQSAIERRDVSGARDTEKQRAQGEV